MRNSFFLRLALGLLSWSSQMVGASTGTTYFNECRSNHLPCADTRDDGSLSKPHGRGARVARTDR